MDLKVTSLEELKKMSQGEIIELPSFNEDIPFVARVKRVSLLNLVRNNIIPNTLLSAAEELFYGKKSSKGDVDMMQLTDVMFTVAQSTLLEPSLNDLKEVGMELTDEQLTQLFNYSQFGVKGLETFRKKSEDNVNSNDGKAIQCKA